MFGGFAAITNSVRDTERVFVVVDSSFQMEAVWGRVARELDRIDDAKFAEFALATEKQSVHSWSDELSLGATQPFAPCGFEEIEDHSEFTQADTVILITTVGNDCDATAINDSWTVIELEP